MSGSSDDKASTNVYAILPDLIKPGSSTHVINLNGYTAATSATSWSEWSFYGAATNGGNNVPGQISSGNYFSYSSGTESWGNAAGARNGGSLALSAYQPTVYPFVGSNGTGSTLSAAVTTFTAAQYSGAVSDYKLQTCAGTSIGGSSPAYTAVQVTLSGFADTGVLGDASVDGFANSFTYGTAGVPIKAGAVVANGLTGTTNANNGQAWFFTGNSVSAFTTFYTGSCSAVTYLGLTLSGAYANYSCVSANTDYHNMTIATFTSRP